MKTLNEIEQGEKVIVAEIDGGKGARDRLSTIVSVLEGWWMLKDTFHQKGLSSLKCMETMRYPFQSCLQVHYNAYRVPSGIWRRKLCRYRD